MALIEKQGDIKDTLKPEDYTSSGELKNTNAELSLVVGCASRAEDFISNRQWALLWRDADLLFSAPRPMTTFENTYILEPNVQRFTVAKVCNAVVPQLYKGLFYQDPPMLIRPRPGTDQEAVDAKTAIFSYLLDACKFKTETKWGLEHMGLFGTGIWKWGVEYKEVIIQKRLASTTSLETGPQGATEQVIAPQDTPPRITTRTKIVPRPFFEFRPVNKVLVDPKVEVGNIQAADYVVDVRYMDFYELELLQRSSEENKEEGWDFPADLKAWWMPPTNDVVPILQTDRATYTDGVVFHAEDINVSVSPDVLLDKKEILEYWDKKRKILVIDRKRVIYTGKNEFGKIPFYSANWWNRPKAFYGLGLGTIVGQNQRVDQGTINAILKILSFGVNPVYLRRRDTNAPTQMIRTGLGRILTVDGDTKDAYKLLESPKVPAEVWAALQESEKATESSSGADQTLVQGSTAGPRTSMGRTAGGAGILANASATRLDGPLDNFIEQVFKPFLYDLDFLVFNYFTDLEIHEILGEELGKEYMIDFQAFHDSKMEYEVLAGSSLAAKRTMAQSLTLIDQVFSNPQIQQSLAEINEEYIDYKPILRMWMEASEWKDTQNIIKPLTPAMKQRMAEKSQAAQQQSKASVDSQSNQQKFEQKQQLEDQANENRIKRDIVREAFRTNSMSEATEGQPSLGGIDGEEPDIA